MLRNPLVDVQFSFPSTPYIYLSFCLHLSSFLCLSRSFTTLIVTETRTTLPPQTPDGIRKTLEVTTTNNETHRETGIQTSPGSDGPFSNKPGVIHINSILGPKPILVRDRVVLRTREDEKIFAYVKSFFLVFWSQKYRTG